MTEKRRKRRNKKVSEKRAVLLLFFYIVSINFSLIIIMKLEHGIRDNDTPWFSELFVCFQGLWEPEFFYETFKKRKKSKNNAQFRRKRRPKGIVPCMRWFDSICLHKTLVCSIFINEWNKSIYPSVKIWVIWLQTNIL